MAGKVLSILMLAAAVVAVSSANDRSTQVLIGDIIKDEVRLFSVTFIMSRLVCTDSLTDISLCIMY